MYVPTVGVVLSSSLIFPEPEKYVGKSNASHGAIEDILEGTPTIFIKEQVHSHSN